jgi:hypothetical protein
MPDFNYHDSRSLDVFFGDQSTSRVLKSCDNTVSVLLFSCSYCRVTMPSSSPSPLTAGSTPPQPGMLDSLGGLFLNPDSPLLFAAPFELPDHVCCRPSSALFSRIWIVCVSSQVLTLVNVCERYRSLLSPVTQPMRLLKPQIQGQVYNLQAPLQLEVNLPCD